MNVRPLITVLAAVAILAPSAAWAGKFSSKSKVTNCTTSTSYFGARTVCRTR